MPTIYEHQCEILPIADGAQAMAHLMGLLDQKSADGFECIAILPSQVAQPTMRNGLLHAQPQPALAVIFRRQRHPPDLLENQSGQNFLDRG